MAPLRNGSNRCAWSGSRRQAAGRAASPRDPVHGVIRHRGTKHPTREPKLVDTPDAPRIERASGAAARRARPRATVPVGQAPTTRGPTRARPSAAVHVPAAVTARRARPRRLDAAAHAEADTTPAAQARAAVRGGAARALHHRATAAPGAVVPVRARVAGRAGCGPDRASAARLAPAAAARAGAGPADRRAGARVGGEALASEPAPAPAAANVRSARGPLAAATTRVRAPAARVDAGATAAVGVRSAVDAALRTQPAPVGAAAGVGTRRAAFPTAAGAVITPAAGPARGARGAVGRGSARIGSAALAGGPRPGTATSRARASRRTLGAPRSGAPAARIVARALRAVRVPARRRRHRTGARGAAEGPVTTSAGAARLADAAAGRVGKPAAAGRAGKARVALGRRPAAGLSVAAARLAGASVALEAAPTLVPRAALRALATALFERQQAEPVGADQIGAAVSSRSARTSLQRAALAADAIVVATAIVGATARGSASGDGTANRGLARSTRGAGHPRGAARFADRAAHAAATRVPARVEPNARVARRGGRVPAGARIEGRRGGVTADQDEGDHQYEVAHGLHGTPTLLYFLCEAGCSAAGDADRGPIRTLSARTGPFRWNCVSAIEPPPGGIRMRF